MKEESIAKQISKLNDKGICTRGIGTFGCACYKCLEILKEYWETNLTPPNEIQ